MPCASSSSSRYIFRFSKRRREHRPSSEARKELGSSMSDPGILQEFKVVIVGDHRVGKTSLLRCWKGDLFEPFSQATIGFDLCTGEYNFPEGNVRLQVWDTAGQEKFNSVTTVQFRNAKVIVFVYDVSNRASFERIADYWLNRVDAFVDEAVPIFIVSNKMDLSPEQCIVGSDEGNRLATAQGASGFFETSAKAGTMVPDLFEKVAQVAFNTWSVSKEPTPKRSFCEHCGHSDDYVLEIQRRGRKLEDSDVEHPSRFCCAMGPKHCSKAKRSPFEPRSLPKS